MATVRSPSIFFFLLYGPKGRQVAGRKKKPLCSSIYKSPTASFHPNDGEEERERGDIGGEGGRERGVPYIDSSTNRDGRCKDNQPRTDAALPLPGLHSLP